MLDVSAILQCKKISYILNSVTMVTDNKIQYYTEK